ncbi:MAG: type 4a pilus biogenesis protein PilO [Myxococcota bacterium]
MDMKSIDFDEHFEKLAKIPKSARYGAVGAILALVAVGYYFSFYQEGYAKLVAQQGHAQELQRKLINVRAVANNVGEFEQEVATLERQLEIALKQLPNRKQFEDLLQDITTAGKQVGVAIKSIERKGEIAHDFYAEVPFSLELEGNYHNIAMFFERVAKLPRIVNIGSMRVEAQRDQNGNGSIELRVEGTATTFRVLNNEADEA